ncbi:MAG: acyltransferase family protein [Lachnospiraceae bacterium]|nr:acyltransferase family protein [Lachnospiraceae bacterium]
MSFTKEEDKSRIGWVDFSKGIAMLLVVVAHTIQGGLCSGMVRGMIYSFHMPLFFILSGFTMRPSENIQSFRKKALKSAKSLLIPAAILYFAWICIELCRDSEQLLSFDFWKGKALTLLFSSASSTVWGETFIAGIGMIWFFFVLFWGKVLFDFVQMTARNIIRNEKDVRIFLIVCSILLAIIGIVFGKYRWLPFSLDIALGIQPFLTTGYLFKSIGCEYKTVSRFLLCILIWAVCFFLTYPNLDNWTYLEIGLRRYSIFPVSYLGAIAGTAVISMTGMYIGCLKNNNICEKGIRMLVKPFYVIGKNSLYFLCVHIMDQLWDFIWYAEDHQIITACKRLGTDLLVFVVVLTIVHGSSKNRSMHKN